MDNTMQSLVKKTLAFAVQFAIIALLAVSAFAQQEVDRQSGTTNKVLQRQ